MKDPCWNKMMKTIFKIQIKKILQIKYYLIGLVSSIPIGNQLLKGIQMHL